MAPMGEGPQIKDEFSPFEIKSLKFLDLKSVYILESQRRWHNFQVLNVYLSSCALCHLVVYHFVLFAVPVILPL